MAQLALSPYLNLLDYFVWGCMESRVNHNGMQETMQQLVDGLIKPAAVIRNQVEYIQ